MTTLRKTVSGFVIALLSLTLMMSAVPVFAQQAQTPISLALESNTIVSAHGLKFAVFGSAVHRGVPLALPATWTVVIERSTGNGAFVQVHRLAGNTFVADANGWYSIPAVNQDGTYTFKILNDLGASALLTAFTVNSAKPFVSVLPRVAEPGTDVSIKLYNRAGQPMDLITENLYAEVFYFSQGRTNVLFNTETSVNAGMLRRVGVGDYRVTAPAFSANISGDPNEYYVSVYSHPQGSGQIGMADNMFKVAQAVVTPPAANEAHPENDTNEDVDLPDPLEPEVGESSNGRDLDIGDEDEETPESDIPNFEFIPAGSAEECVDTSGHWGEVLIGRLINERKFPFFYRSKKITCRPNSVVTRKMMATWILFANHPQEARAAIQMSVTAQINPFTDLDNNDPYARYVIKASQLGLVSGKNGCARAARPTNCTFGPNDELKRAELITMLAQPYFTPSASAISELKRTNAAYNPRGKFADITSEKDWFYGYLYFAYANNMISGVTVRNKVEAQMGRSVTFAEAAAILDKSFFLQPRVIRLQAK